MTILYCHSSWNALIFVCTHDLINSKGHNLFVQSYENVAKVNLLCMGRTQLRDDQMEL